MGARIFAAGAAATAVLAFVAGAAAAPAPGFTELVSLSSAGVQGNQDSEAPAVSADGRFVAFVSLADNLVAGDTNGVADVFVRDRLLGTTERVSLSSAGRQSDGHSGVFNGMGDPSISADGRFVVFDSEATNFAKGDANTTSDVFVHDRVTGTTELASIAANGSPAGASSDGTISDDGRRVAYVSFADNIVQPDTNFTGDVFVRDLATGVTVRVSDAPDGSQANSQSFHPDLNGNGHLVAFDSFASNLVASGADDSSVDVFVHDLDAGVTESISGPESSGSFGHSSGASITPDGRFVVFSTQDPTILRRDTNGFVEDVLIFDRTTGVYELVSVNDKRSQGDDNSSQGVASADGRFVAFTSFATNMVPEDTNFRLDVFVRDRVERTTRRVSVGSAGEEGDLDSLAPAIDAGGSVIGFSSRASTFVPETQTFFASDIFVRDARPAADLSVALADSPDPASIRGDVTYTATVSNAGPSAATGVTLVAGLPDATFVSASGASCVRTGSGKSGGTLTCSVGTLAAGSSAAIAIVVRPTHDGTLSLTASVHADQPDPDGGDNTATETTTVVR